MRRSIPFLTIYPLIWMMAKGQDLPPQLIRITSTLQTLPNTEYQGLFDLYQATHGKYWEWRTNSSMLPWNFTIYDPSAPCSNAGWQGIHCSCSVKGDCHVQQLILPQYNLTGTLPYSIGSWPKLEILILSSNYLIGSLPITITNLTSLLSLELHVNYLEGTLPVTIGNLGATLQQIDLRSNSFNGTLPASFYNLTGLQKLQLDFNRFEGTISKQVGNLIHLQYFTIYGNNFQGKIPHTIGNLTQLSILAMALNVFTSTIPIEMYELTNLSLLLLSGNQLTGTISPKISQLINITGLFIYQNNFFGHLPEEMYSSQMMKIRSLSIGYNLFSGTISENISHWEKSLTSFFYCANSFTGMLPHAIWNYHNLIALEINNNFLTHSVHTAFINSSFTLVYFYLGYNQFTGYIPTADWKVITYYEIPNNYLIGNISTSNIFSTTTLNIITLAVNYLTGTIPSNFNHNSTTNLNFFNISFNFFTGNLENTFQGLITLQQLDVSYNQLTGTIPSSYGEELILLKYLFLNNNQLTGILPSTFQQLSKLQILSIQNNQLHGSLPENFITATNISTIDISSNRFTGTLPVFYHHNGSNYPYLETLSYSSNCFHGTLSEVFCQLPAIETLSFDGLSAASYCRNYFSPSSTFFFSSFTLHFSVSGTIPPCFYQIPTLQTFHLSGNAFTSTLPSNVNLSNSQLDDLILSHNQLRGTIPSSFQQHSWKKAIDLSYNKFTGTLSSQWNTINANQSSVSLQLNRLSGLIPAGFLSYQTISMLQGNMFTCNFDKNDLPQNDQEATDYSCGSDVVNTSIYLWLSFLSLLIILPTVTVTIWRKTVANWANRAAVQKETGNNSLAEKESMTFLKDLTQFCFQLYQWRQLFQQRCYYDLFNDYKVSSRFESTDNPAPLNTTSLPSFANPPKAFSSWIYSSRLFKLSFFVQHVRQLFFYITLYVIVVLTPLYGILTVLYSQYTFSYVWAISGILMTGLIAGICLLTLWIIGFLIFVTLYKILISFHQTRKSTENNHLLDQVQQQPQHQSKATATKVLNIYRDSNLHFPTQKKFDNSNIKEKDDEKDEKDEKVTDADDEKDVEGRPSAKEMSARSSSIMERLQKKETKERIVLAIIGFCNFIIMMLADIIYVIVVLNSNLVATIFAEITLAVFKLLLNNYLLWWIIPYLHQYFSPKLSSTNNLTPPANHKVVYHYSVRELTFISFTILLNNIIFPALTIFIISPDCFYNLLFTPQTVNVSYSSKTCVRFNVILQQCLHSTTFIESSSYDPPFTYSYQCSSRILVQYAAVFIMMTTLEGIVTPILRLMAKFLYDRDQRLLKKENKRDNQQLDKEARKMEDFEAAVKNSTDEKESKQNDETLFQRIIRLIAISSFIPLIPRARSGGILSTDLIPSSSRSNQRSMDSELLSSVIIFNKSRFMVRIHSYLSILLTFGMIFPPLAMMLTISIFILTTMEEITIGRILSECEKAQQQSSCSFNESSGNDQANLNYEVEVYYWYLEQIHLNCKGISNSLRYSLWTILPIAAAFDAYLMFDTVGDAIGAYDALPYTLLMMFVPLAIAVLATFVIRAYRWYAYQKLQSSLRKNSTTTGVALQGSLFHASENNSTKIERGNELMRFSEFIHIENPLVTRQNSAGYDRKA